MRGKIKLLVVGIILCVASVVSAASWPQLQARLHQWSGAKEVVLPAGVDPLEDAVLAPVVDLLLEQGFAVLPDGSGGKDGLTIEVRATSHGRRLLLKRAADGALLAMEKLDSVTTNAPLVLSTPPPAPLTMVAQPAAPYVPTVHASAVSATSTQLSVQQPPPAIPNGEVLFELDGAPLQLVTWPLGAGKVDIYLLYDAYVQRLRCDGHSLQLLDTFYAPVKPARALHLDIGDLDGDGQPELAAVWGEDVRGVADGTDTVLHSWLLSVDSEGMQVVSDDLHGYVSLAGDAGRLQKRLPYKMFAPDIYSLTLDNGRVTVSATPVAQQGRLLFNQLTWPDDSRALVWNDDQRLMLVAQGNATRIPGSTLLTDFGRYQGAIVSVPLKETEYRSGFSANDRIMAHEYSLNRRLLSHGGAVFTIVRARTEGLPIVGHPSGADRIVKISNTGERLGASYPFAQVDAFMVDFSLIGTKPAQAAVLLNEKAAGSGRAYLRLQQQL